MSELAQTPADVKDQLAAELGTAAAVEKFAAEVSDGKLRKRVLKLNSPVHTYMLGLMREYQG